MNDILLIFSGNIDTRTQIQTIAKKELLDCFFLSYGDHLADMAKRLEPFLIIIDFTSQNADWAIKHLGEVKTRRSSLRVIGVIRSEAGEGEFTRLEKAGCDFILTKHSLLEKLPSILQTHS